MTCNPTDLVRIAVKAAGQLLHKVNAGHARLGRSRQRHPFGARIGHPVAGICQKIVNNLSAAQKLEKGQ